MPSATARRRLVRTRAASALAVAALAVGIAAPAATAVGHPSAGNATHTPSNRPGTLDPSQFKGVNWADPRDNFADDAVIPSGLLASDSPQTTYRKAHEILLGFRKNLGANTVRLPVNPYSVGTSSAWWPDYQQVVRAASRLGFKVVLGYWEGPGAEDDGIVDDPAAWWSMWRTLTTTYATSSNVYFEPMNEPHGYTEEQWTSLAASWLETFRAVPRDRVFVSGIGYSDHVNDLCADPALDGTYLALHDYGYWGTRTYAEWVDDLASRIGDCAGRTVLDEFGAPMTTGIDYTASSTASDADTNNSVSFMQAATDTVRRLHLGSVYWPGLRTGDTYSLESLTTTHGHLALVDNNATGRALVEWGWGRGNRSPHPVG